METNSPDNGDVTSTAIQVRIKDGAIRASVEETLARLPPEAAAIPTLTSITLKGRGHPKEAPSPALQEG